MESTVNTKLVTSHKKSGDSRWYLSHHRSQRVTFRWVKEPSACELDLDLFRQWDEAHGAGYCCSHVLSICFSMTWKILIYSLFLKKRKEKKNPQVL